MQIKILFFFQFLKSHNSQTTRYRDMKFAIRVDPEVGFKLHPVPGVHGGEASNSGHWIWLPTLEAHNSETNRAIGLKIGGHTDLEPN